MKKILIRINILFLILSFCGYAVTQFKTSNVLILRIQNLLFDNLDIAFNIWIGTGLILALNLIIPRARKNEKNFLNNILELESLLNTKPVVIYCSFQREGLYKNHKVIYHSIGAWRGHFSPVTISVITGNNKSSMGNLSSGEFDFMYKSYTKEDLENILDELIISGSKS